MGRKNNNTSPARTPDPAIPARLFSSRNPKDKLEEDTKKPNSVAKNVTDNKAAATTNATASQDSCELWVAVLGERLEGGGRNWLCVCVCVCVCVLERGMSRTTRLLPLPMPRRLKTAVSCGWLCLVKDWKEEGETACVCVCVRERGRTSLTRPAATTNATASQDSCELWVAVLGERLGGGGRNWLCVCVCVCLCVCVCVCVCV